MARVRGTLGLNRRGGGGLDGRLQPDHPGSTDLGAAELESGDVIFAEGFESGDVSAWSSTAP
ncbi:MAG: hypothetical protein AAFY88_04850 [Acidobacteriota bacterium]